jgi:hypothetical protein
MAGSDDEVDDLHPDDAAAELAADADLTQQLNDSDLSQDYAGVGDDEVIDDGHVQPVPGKLSRAGKNRLEKLVNLRTSRYASITKFCKDMAGMAGRSNVQLRTALSHADSTRVNLEIIRTEIEALSPCNEAEAQKFEDYITRLDSMIGKIKTCLALREKKIKKDENGGKTTAKAAAAAAAAAAKPTVESPRAGGSGYVPPTAAPVTEQNDWDDADSEIRDEDLNVGDEDPAVDSFQLRPTISSSATQRRGPGEPLRGGGNQNVSARLGTRQQTDYKGMPRVSVAKFSGEEDDYQFFKAKFHIAYGRRHVPKDELAVILLDHLVGVPKRIAQSQCSAKLDHFTYDTIWDLLDNKFGGLIRDSQNVMEVLHKQPILKDLSLVHLEKFFEMLSIQRVYYEEFDPTALTRENNLLIADLKRKISQNVCKAYLDWAMNGNRLTNFRSLSEFIQTKITVAQRSEKESPRVDPSFPARNKSDNKSDKSKNQVHTLDAWGYDECPPCDEGFDNAEFETMVNAVADRLGHPPSRGGDRSSFSRESRPKTTWSARPVTDFKKTTSWGGGASSLSKNFDLCPMCKVEHKLTSCPKFRVLNLQQKYSLCKANNLCYHCLQGGHGMAQCKTKSGELCGKDKCTRYHHPMIHPNSTVNHVCLETWDETNEDDPIPLDLHLHAGEDNFNNYVSLPGAVSLQTVVCRIKGRHGLSTIALLDSGSNTTMIDEDVAVKLKMTVLKGPVTRELHLMNQPVTIQSSLVQLELQSLDAMTTQVLTAWTTKDLTKNTGVVDWSKEKGKFEHLSKVPFPKLPPGATIQILIGLDNAHLFDSIETVKGGQTSDPVAKLTPLGWTCLGHSRRKSDVLATFQPILSQPK